MPPVPLHKSLINQYAYNILEEISNSDHLPIKVKDLIITIDDKKLKKWPINPDLLRTRVKKLLSVHPNTYSFLCTYNQAEKAEEIAKKIKRHQACIAEYLATGAEKTESSENLLPEEKVLLTKLAKMSHFRLNDLPDKESWEEYQAYSHAYWLARANNYPTLANKIAKTWLQQTHHPQYAKDIKDLEHLERVLSNLARADDLKNLSNLWELANTEFPESEHSLRRAIIVSACPKGNLEIIQYLFNTIEEKTAFSNYLNQEPSIYLAFILQACASGHRSTLEWIVDLAKKSAYASKLFEIDSDHNPLAKVCRSGNLDAVKFVLAQIPKEKLLRAITQARRGYRAEYSNDAVHQACLSRNPKVLARILKPLEKEQIEVIFSPHYQPANSHPLTYARDVAMTAAIFRQMPETWAEEIINSEVYTHCLISAYGRMDTQQASYLLDKLTTEKLIPAVILLNTKLDAMVLDSHYDITPRDREAIGKEITAYYRLRKLAKLSPETTLTETQPKQALADNAKPSTSKLVYSFFNYMGYSSDSDSEKSIKKTARSNMNL